MQKVFFILVFISVSCTKWAKVQKSSGIYKIEKLNSEIFNIKNIDWKVGIKRGAIVSKGFSFKVDIPRIDSSGRDILYQKYGIDSLLYRVVKKQRGRTQRIGLLRFDFKNMSKITSDLTFHIFYHAASISDRFRRFHCPAFNHRFILKDFEIKSDNDDQFNLYTKNGSYIKGKIEKPAFAPVIFSGGRSLKGEYYVEIALFNSSKKRIYSTFEKVGNSIKISQEQVVTVPSCIGIKEERKPLPSSKEFSLKDLEIK